MSGSETQTHTTLRPQRILRPHPPGGRKTLPIWLESFFFSWGSSISTGGNLSPSIDVVTLRDQSPAQMQLVDVRSASEFASGHIPGAVNIPMDQIEGRLDDLRPKTPLVLICQTGKRARMTAGLLEPCQREIAVLEGGTSAWIRAGLPV